MATAQADAFAAFDHFSYQVDWSNFPNSLIITGHLQDETLLESKVLIETQLTKIVQFSLLKHGIKFRDFRKNIKFSALT